MRFYAIGLCGYAGLRCNLLVNAFYAVDRRKTPMVVSFIAGWRLNLALNYFLYAQTRLGAPRAGLFHRLRGHEQLPDPLTS